MVFGRHSIFRSNLTKIDYIEATGTQYIDTGVCPSPTTIVELDVVVRTTSAWTQFFGWSHGDKRHGCRTRRSGSALFAMTWDSDLEWAVGVPGWDEHYNDSDIGVHRIVSDSTNNSVSVDGTVATDLAWTGWFGSYNGTQGSMLLGVGGDGTKANGVNDSFKSGYVRFYGVKIWQDGSLVRSFSPVAFRVSGQLQGAMHDSVTKTVFVNLGTGVFGFQK